MVWRKKKKTTTGTDSRASYPVDRFDVEQTKDPVSIEKSQKTMGYLSKL